MVITAGGVVEVGWLQAEQPESIIIAVRCKRRVVIVVKHKAQSIS